MDTVPSFARRSIAAMSALTITATLMFASFAPPAQPQADADAPVVVLA